jgi:hypothetical protein
MTQWAMLPTTARMSMNRATKIITGLPNHLNRGRETMKIGGYTINRKEKVYSVSDVIGDCRRTGLWGFYKTKPFYVFFEYDNAGRKLPNFRYFDDLETAIQYKDAIKQLVA